MLAIYNQSNKEDGSIFRLFNHSKSPAPIRPSSLAPTPTPACPLFIKSLQESSASWEPPVCCEFSYSLVSELCHLSQRPNNFLDGLPHLPLSR